MHWGYVLIAPGRLSERSQLDVVRTLVTKSGPKVRTDIVAPDAPAYRTSLPERSKLLKVMADGDTVFVADPFCLGLSLDDVKWFLMTAGKRGVTICLNGTAVSIRPGDRGVLALEAYANALHRFQSARARIRSNNE